MMLLLILGVSEESDKQTMPPEQRWQETDECPLCMPPDACLLLHTLPKDGKANLIRRQFRSGIHQHHNVACGLLDIIRQFGFHHAVVHRLGIDFLISQFCHSIEHIGQERTIAGLTLLDDGIVLASRQPLLLHQHRSTGHIGRPWRLAQDGA